MDIELDVIGKVLPRSINERVERMITLAGIRMRPEAFTGAIVLLCVIVPVFVFLLLAPFIPQYALVVALCSIAVVIGLSYAYVLLKVDERRRAVESVLPDFLQLASANVRAGMPIDRALWFAARPEFGLLSQEVALITKRTFSGEPFVKSLRKLSESFDSKLLERTVNLLIEGMASGGEVAALLEKMAWDIRSLQLLHKEIAGMMTMYIIFIIFASCFGAPLLYALSNQLISITNHIWAGILAEHPEGLPSGGVTFITPQPPGVTSQDFFTFALLSLVATTMMASFIIAVINKGNAAEGIKYMPFMVATSLAVFFIVGWIFQTVFAGIFK